MKTAFLILTHKNPIQLSEIVSHLGDENSGVFIHIDKRSDRLPFEKSLSSQSFKNYHLFQHTKIIYSSVSYIDACMPMIRKAFELGYDYFVLLSGQDHPLKPINEILSFYEKNKESNYLTYNEIPYAELAYNGLMRTEYLNFIVKNRMETLFPFKDIKHKISTKGKALNFLLFLRSFGQTRRKFPLNMTPYYSSQWWNISRKGIEYVLNFIDSNPEYYKYHKRALHPEEMFFQSILLNSPLKKTIVNDNLRHIEWKPGNKHPETLELDNFKNIDFDPKDLFARKVDLKK